MSQFFRLLTETDKARALQAACNCLRQGLPDFHTFEVSPESFDAVPGKPFTYWVNNEVRSIFHQLPKFESEIRFVRQGGITGHDERYLRLWWETLPHLFCHNCRWVPYAKGGSFSRWYSDLPLTVFWDFSRGTFFGFTGLPHRPSEKPASADHYFKPGLTWPRRSQRGLSLRAMARGCVFADKGPSVFMADDDPDELLSLLAITNSRAFSLLVSLQMAFGSYEVGVMQRTPVPPLNAEQRRQLAGLAHRAWSLKRTADTIAEASHAFVLPAALRQAGICNVPDIENELSQIMNKIDAIAFNLYGFAKANCEMVTVSLEENNTEGDDDDDDAELSVQSADALLSWAVGVAFGRFDWRLATGERNVPPEPQPFDPLPLKSPGMLPDGAKPFHDHFGILVDDLGHRQDLARIVEEVLTRVDLATPDDVRRWLQRDFFPFHLQCYSKSRRKAPIYWPLATVSGNYTLWIYYPSLSSQTLYTAINDFVEPKLKQVLSDADALRRKGTSRSRDDEKQFEALQAVQLELIELRDTLLKLAPSYKPSHDDGVQITAAPLWPLFRYKPWQKLLKDTWTKMEKGGYDWAHLSMNYWPDRVHEKCKTDKSLAIAHGVEALFIEPEIKPKSIRGGSKK